jgi:hypothetical protein
MLDLLPQILDDSYPTAVARAKLERYRETLQRAIRMNMSAGIHDDDDELMQRLVWLMTLFRQCRKTDARIARIAAIESGEEAQ